MEIILNGAAKQVPQQSSIKDLLAEIGVLGERVAIELNQEVVPKSEYASRQLQAADQIEIIQAVGGG
ncbi:sulfur carrier protein ThiS [Gammaproteobacteria bacterium]|jgi:sulfur carrier protein|nr:sulfur carrier protein ThiS [Pseudomonadota bacterium]MDB0064077.1 sulfur carrier protein ThiS [Gammaproteobacteria bacterium]